MSLFCFEMAAINTGLSSRELEVPAFASCSFAIVYGLMRLTRVEGLLLS